MEWRKKPVVINAFQMQYDNIGDLKKWVESFGQSFESNFNFKDQGPDGANLSVNTLEGVSYNTKKRDWIIRGVNGEFYPCKPDIFEKTYERVDESNSIEGEAVAFADFINNEYWRKMKDDLWYNMVNNTLPSYTTSQLYELFKKQK